MISHTTIKYGMTSSQLTNGRQRSIPALGIVDVEVGGVRRIVPKRERRILVAQELDVRGHPPPPAIDADDVVEEPARIRAGEDDREERDQVDENHPDEQHREHDEVRKREQPLDQRQKAGVLVLALGLDTNRIGRGLRRGGRWRGGFHPATLTPSADRS